MSAPPTSRGAPVTDKRQLVEYLEEGCKAPEDWRLGTEHEKLLFHTDTLRRVPYEGERGIGQLLTGLQRFGWDAVLEEGLPIALSRGAASITLEPGGQFELSGAPLRTLHETFEETAQHLTEVRTVAGELGIGMLGLAFDPTSTVSEVPIMPKGRYGIMRSYMPKKGRRGLDMMLRTTTVQVNVDFSSEADMVRKMRVSMALQPVATALFANSPFMEGRPSGYLSLRSQTWTDTDPDRSGMIPFVFEEGFGFERYVDWLLDVPMYFIFRDGRYVDASGQSFRDFMNGRLPAAPGEVPGMGDWSDHLTTAFPEVRLKRFLEMRGADSGLAGAILALPAFWVGLLYDATSLSDASDLVREWSVPEMLRLRDAVPAEGLGAVIAGRPLRDWARELLEISAAGLARRGERNGEGQDERRYLAYAQEVADSGFSQAERLLKRYEGEWNGSVKAAFTELTY